MLLEDPAIAAVSTEENAKTKKKTEKGGTIIGYVVLAVVEAAMLKPKENKTPQQKL